MLRILILLLFSVTCYADNETLLADKIWNACNFNEDNILSIKEEDCMVYYVNCVIGKRGKWTNEDFIRCQKDIGNHLFIY